MTQQHEPLIVARDRFGLAVVEELGAPPGAVLVLSSRLHPAHLPFGDPIVVAHAGHDPELRSTIDAVAFERGVPSVGVELLPTRIVCGPVVVPGRTACYGCAERRLLQHSGERVPLEVSTRDLPEGFATHHAAIAAGLVRAALAEIAAPRPGPGGTVRVFDLVTGAVRASHTIAVNRCPRCSDRFRGDQPVRALAELL